MSSSTAVQVHNGSAPVEGPGTALAEIRPAARLLVPIAAPAEIIAAQEATRDLVTKALKQGRDWGKVKGIDKPFLMKPGAERIAIGFGCYFGGAHIVEQEIDHDRLVRWTKRKKRWLNRFDGDKEFEWEEESGESLGLYRYVIAVPVIHRETGQVVGEGLGSCSTMESKYVDRPRDSENTALKMAHKRALVAATLLAFGLSDQFTQDEDVVEPLEDDERGAGSSGSTTADEPPAECPKCGGGMWDNRKGKKNPKAPDFKCKDKACGGVLWPGQWPPKPKDDSQLEAPLEGNGGGSPASSGGRATPVSTPATSNTGPHFPRNKKFPHLSNVPLSEISTADLITVLPWLRDLGQDKLADACAEVLVGRDDPQSADDGLPPALQAEPDDLPFS